MTLQNLKQQMQFDGNTMKLDAALGQLKRVVLIGDHHQVTIHLLHINININIYIYIYLAKNF